VHANEQATVADRSAGWYSGRGRSGGSAARLVQSDRIVIRGGINRTFCDGFQSIASATPEPKRLAMDKRFIPAWAN
jgi:hypothetical protein